MREVVILGVGMHDFGKFTDIPLRTLARVAAWNALKDAGVSPPDVEVAYVGNALAGLITGQECVRGQIMLREVGIVGIPVTNVENACASGSTAFHEAYQAVAGGFCDVALALGAEKMFCHDTGRTLRALEGAADVEVVGGTGLQFTALYAMRLRKKMDEEGLTAEHLAQIAVKNHSNGMLNPYAQHHREFTVEEVLASRPIADPLTLLMCSPIGDGAAAAVVCSAEAARRYTDRPLVRVEASVLRSGIFRDSHTDLPTTVALAANTAYERAGLTPEDIDVAEVHDGMAPGEIWHYEDLGFCPRGESKRYIKDGAFGLGGHLPVNPSGGLTSRGHPVGATGLAQIAEVTWQLRGEAGARQVRGARIGLTQNGGGWIAGDQGACTVHIFSVRG